MLECVPNVSEGRDPAVLAALDAACGGSLLDRHTDADHNRSVFTLAAPDPIEVETAMRALARAVAEHVSIREHAGVHPRLGALDVVPFVALDAGDDARADARRAACEFAAWWSSSFAVPVFLYGDADEHKRTLPSTRRSAFRDRRPDLGPERPHDTLGSTAVGVRRPLVAINCVLDTADIAVARAIAHAVRERDGGLAGVRALGFALASRAITQVSMNVTDLERTGIESACRRVDQLAAERGVTVSEVELVGLLPASERARCSDQFRGRAGIDEDATIERRWARRNG